VTLSFTGHLLVNCSSILCQGFVTFYAFSQTGLRKSGPSGSRSTKSGAKQMSLPWLMEYQ
jgi:hypothetical protein